MDFKVSTTVLIKSGFKLLFHKVLQFFLRTKDTHVLRTENGLIRGVKRKTVYSEDGTYYAFEGIPYAKPPIGDLRFRAPKASECWNDIRDCTYCRNKPIQQHFVLNITEGSEDCLYLNVYVKKLCNTPPLPVMVWIYGGGFQIGEASRDIYAPDYFMKKSMVLVQLNYRLGALGFLSLRDPDLGVPGNAGLKDQLLALRWIKANIANFNGDPNNITLFGESAGAASVHIMMLCEQAKGLFHKAILQSGNALSPWTIAPTGINWANRLAVALKYKGGCNDKQIFSFLNNLDGATISSVVNRLLTEAEKRNTMLFPFAPVVEPYINDDCLIAKPLIKLLPNAWSNNIPLIIGGNTNEGLFWHFRLKTHPQWISELDESNCVVLLPTELRLQETSLQQQRQMAETLRSAHFGKSAPNFSNYLDVLSYKSFWHSIHRTIRARCKYAEAPTYVYRFDFDSPNFNHYRILSCGSEVRGAAHADDLSYLFYNINAWKLPQTSNEYKTIKRMIGMWTSFAKNSNPNCPEIKPCVWEPVSQQMLCGDNNLPAKCLNIGDDLEFIDLPEHNKLTVWDRLYKPEELF